MRQDGAPVTLRGFMIDITERKRAEQALGESEERLRAWMDNSDTPITLKDMEGRYLLANERFSVRFNVSREEIVGKTAYDIFPPEYADEISAHDRKVLETGTATERETQTPLPDGTTRTTIMHKFPIIRPDGGYTGVGTIEIDITERKRAEELRRNLSARLISAQEEERMKISRELHDDFGQRLALLAVEIQRLGQNISEPEFEGAKSMDKLWSQARELSTDLNRLSHQLHPAILDQLGLGPAIRSLCSEISKQHGIQIKFTEHEVPASISQDIALCLYRTVQEGLRNIVKHSGAKDAKVELTGGPDTIHLRIADRGVGFDPATTKGKGIGLISIEERVRLVRGEMSLQSRPSHGTCIDLRIPSAVPDA